MSTYLFLFTISPVQSFIAQARKTKDLYSGSKILSDLIGFAISQMPSGTEFIFPSPKLDSKPNRFIAKINADDDNKLKTIGDNLSDSVQEEFKKNAIEIFKKITKRKENDLPANFISQINNHLQIHWVALPFEEADYKDKYKEIESSLGAIKNIRVFNQTEETGRKCSICGERNLIFCGRGNKTKLQLKPNWELVSENDKKIVNDFNNSILEVNEPFGSSEGLCAVCFTKRFYEEKQFPSTAEIALMDTISKLEENTNIKSAMQEYKNLLKSDFDYQLFFKENLNQKYFEKQQIKTKLVDAQKNYDSLKNQIKTKKLTNLKFSPYYAVIMFDGDSMGKWLSGEYLKSDSPLMEFHQTLSQSLGEFAKEAHRIVSGTRGRVVFAGGEDFLAFVNLNYLFSVMVELRNKFDEMVSKVIDSYKSDSSKNLTFSAGIVIAHYKMPLSEVLKWARAMEKEAKNIDDNKNAFAIAVMKHSGEINKSIYKWSDDSDLTANLKSIEKVSTKLKKEEFSNTFIKNLNKELQPLLDSDKNFSEKELIKSEIDRLISHSCMLKKNHGEKEEDFHNRVIKPFSDDVKSLLSSSPTTDNFLSALNISEFISRHLNGETK